MKTTFVALLFIVATCCGQSSSHFECLSPTPSNQSGVQAANPAASPLTLDIQNVAGTIKPIILYCVNIGEDDRLPAYLNTIPSRLLDYYDRTSFHHFRLEVAGTLKKDDGHAFIGRVPFNYQEDNCYICSEAFMRDIFDQADQRYDFGEFDNDGPDGVPNSGDDDGIVDFIFFVMLNYSSRGVAGLYGMNSIYVTTDLSHAPSGGNIVISPSGRHSTLLRKDLRDIVFQENDYLGAMLHEGGHCFCNLPDMDHESLTQYKHFSLGSYDVMANGFGDEHVHGFVGIASPYNPWFREARGWVSPVPIAGTASNVVLSDFDHTGITYKYSPNISLQQATPINDYMVTYHRKDLENRWTWNWPLGDAGGVLIWRVSSRTVGLYDAYQYVDPRMMPIDIEAAHGKYLWTGRLNTGVANALIGFDSIEVREVSTDSRSIIWYPYLHASSQGIGSRSVMFEPGREYTFYSNPTSNYYSSVAGEGYARGVISGFSVKNIRFPNETAILDFDVSDFHVQGNAVLHRGTWYVPQTITIDNGAILSIEAGTTLKFAIGKSLLVNGVLNAVGTAQQPIKFTSSSSSWSGISISGSGANGSTMDYCTIDKVQSYGGSAISVSGTQGTAIRHCSITNNLNYGTSGIFFYNAGSPEIFANTITANGGYGLNFYSTNGNVYGNLITGNSSGGISCNNASPQFGKVGFPAYYGNNVITGGSYGIYAGNYSYPYVGSQYMSYYGYNKIESNSTARICATGHTEVLAEKNWWGATPPNSAWFQAYNYSLIEWTPYLDTDPFDRGERSIVTHDGEQIPPSPSFSVSSSDLATPAFLGIIRQVAECRANGLHDKAIALLLGTADAIHDLETARRFVLESVSLGREDSDRRLLLASQEIRSRLGVDDPIILLALAQLCQQNSTFSEANQLLLKLQADHPSSDIEMHALASQYFSASPTSTTASSIARSLGMKYPNDPLVRQVLWTQSVRETRDASFGLEPSINQSIPQASEEPIPVAVYPNPFNPSTTINYRLSAPSFTCIKVFDILGRQVAILVSEDQPAGEHVTHWNASGLTSGIYFLRFQINEFFSVHKMILSK